MDATLLQILENMRHSKSNKHVILSLKAVLNSLGASLTGETFHGGNIHIEILIELIFIPESSFMHKCYLSFIRSLPPAVQDLIIKGWINRLLDISLKEPITAMEIMHSISSMGKFPGIHLQICKYCLEILIYSLEKCLESLSDNFISEEDQATLEKLSIMGYSIMSKCSSEITSNSEGHLLLEKCANLTVMFLQVRFRDQLPTC